MEGGTREGEEGKNHCMKREGSKGKGGGGRREERGRERKGRIIA